MRWLLLLMLFPIIAVGQNSNNRCEVIRDFNRPLHFDTLTLNPSSFSVNYPTDITYLAPTNEVILTPRQQVDSVLFCFKVFNISVNKALYHQESTNLSSQSINRGRPPQKTESEVEGSSIISSGVIDRGVNISNRTDMSMDSYMDFTFEGKLTDEVEIHGRLFDQNIPFQPEGNTNSLKNFNRIYVELEGENSKIGMGDIALKSTMPGFLKYNRQITGFYASLKDSTLNVSVGGGVAKGKYTINILSVTDGFNGPYKLKGPSNEPYVIVVAGSEKVFIDGNLADRGKGKQYTIDYDLGEISFEPSELITAATRVRVEFEYRSFSYQRSSLAFDFQKKIKNTEWVASVYREKDEVRQLPDLFSSGVIQQIQNASSGEVLSPSALEVQFNENKISYELKDTTDTDGIVKPIYVYSDNPSAQHYAVTFNKIEGGGEYKRVYTTANGVIYEWVGTLNNLPQGEFGPVQLIQAPSSHIISSVGFTTTIHDKDKVMAEVSLSDDNQNVIANSNIANTGVAVKAGAELGNRFFGSERNYYFSAALYSEFISSNYRLFDPFRTVEFDREWSGNNLNVLLPTNEMVVVGTALVGNGDGDEFSWKSTIRNRENQLRGSRNEFVLMKNLGPFQLNSGYRYTNSSNLNLNNEWKQLNLEFLHQSNRSNEIGFGLVTDHNEQNDIQTNQFLYSQAFRTDYSLFWRSEIDSSALNWKMEAIYRNNSIPLNGELTQQDPVVLYKGQLMKQGKNVSYSTGVQFRNRNPGVTERGQLSGFLELGLTVWERLISNKIRLTSMNSWEPRRSFVYLAVPSGQGFFTWRDDNADGIQQLDEFYDAVNPDEMNYVRFYTPEVERVPVLFTAVNYSGKINFPENWKETNGVKKVLSGVGVNYYLDNEIKSKVDSQTLQWNLLTMDLADSSLLQARRRLGMLSNWQSANRKWRMEYSVRSFGNKFWMNSGYQINQQVIQLSEFIFHLNERSEIKGGYGQKLTEKKSDFLSNQNFSVNGQEIHSSIIFNANDGLALSITGGLGKNSSLNEPGSAFSKLNKLAVQMDKTLLQKTRLNGKLEWIGVQYEGILNSPLSYELLEANSVGDNYIWQLNVKQRLKNGMNIFFIYYGRKAGESPAVHRGSLQLSAYF